MRGLTPEEMAFMSEAAIATDGGRFNAKLDSGAAATGKVLMYISGTPTGAAGITQEQFRALFKASQQSATADKFANSFASNPRFFASDGDVNAKKAFRRAAKAAYVAVFPHTAILGETLKDTTNWLNFKGMLAAFPATVPPALLPAIKAAFDAAEAAPGGMDAQKKTDEVERALNISSSEISAYLKRLFQDTNPI